MRKWALRGAAALALLVLVLGAAGWILARRLEPFAREQAIRYLQERFGTGVKLASFHVSVSLVSPLKLRAAVLRLSGGGLELPPLIRVGKFAAESELFALWGSTRRIREVRLDRVDINVPPKERRASPAGQAGTSSNTVVVDTIRVDSLTLNMQPSDPAKPPRVFEVHQLTLKGAGPGRRMKFSARLTNPKPPGQIQTSGDFGPWQRDDPGLTPISGEYTFKDADLSVFRTIGGTLSSTGRFRGVLRRIEVQGETRTPDFHLAGGNPVPLATRFESIVDGTSGDTLLQPVRATLGRSTMIAHGGVVHRRGDRRRTVDLNVTMSGGRIEDLLRLAVKSAQPFLRGDIDLKTKLVIPPSAQTVGERLLLDGGFNLQQARFASHALQEKIDNLSRRARGQPDNPEVSDVLTDIGGGFQLRDGQLRFSSLAFHVPGAAIHLKGTYALWSGQIDLHGTARLQATVSQTMTGWKRWALKPVDPLFSKRGAGTLLPIKVAGTREKPEFGLDRGGKESERAAPRTN